MHFASVAATHVACPGTGSDRQREDDLTTNTRRRSLKGASKACCAPISRGPRGEQAAAADAALKCESLRRAAARSRQARLGRSTQAAAPHPAAAGPGSRSKPRTPRSIDIEALEEAFVIVGGRIRRAEGHRVTRRGVRWASPQMCSPRRHPMEPSVLSVGADGGRPRLTLRGRSRRRRRNDCRRPRPSAELMQVGTASFGMWHQSRRRCRARWRQPAIDPVEPLGLAT